MPDALEFCRVSPLALEGYTLTGPQVNQETRYRIIRRVAKGKPNKVIAYELNLSLGTIKQYLNQITHELGLRDRVALAVWYTNKLREMK